MLASLFLIGALGAVPQLPIQAAGQTIVEDNDSGITSAANRMIGGIVSYARWPDGSHAARSMCVIGAPRLTERLAPVVTGGPIVAVRHISPAAAVGGQPCDIFFLGRMSAADRQRLIGWVRARAVCQMRSSSQSPTPRVSETTPPTLPPPTQVGPT